MTTTGETDVEDDLRSPAAPVRTERVVVVLAVVAAVVLTSGVLVEHVRVHRLDGAPAAARFFAEQGSRLLYVDREANAWAWLSSVVLALLALVLAASSAACRGAGLRWGPLALLAATALLLSADEGAMLHETLNEVGIRLTDALGGFNAWLVPGVVVVLVAGVVLLRVARGIDPWLRRRLVLAGALFLAGALGMELVGALLALSSDAANPWETGTYHVLVAVEEGLEMAGALVALRAALATVEVRVGAGGVAVVPVRPGRLRG